MTFHEIQVDSGISLYEKLQQLINTLFSQGAHMDVKILMRTCTQLHIHADKSTPTGQTHTAKFATPTHLRDPIANMCQSLETYLASEFSASPRTMTPTTTHQV